MVLLAHLCKIWINVSLLNILNILKTFMPYTVITCREGGGRNINSETNHCTNQLNSKARIVSKFTIPKMKTFKLYAVTL